MELSSYIFFISYILILIIIILILIINNQYKKIKYYKRKELLIKEKIINNKVTLYMCSGRIFRFYSAFITINNKVLINSSDKINNTKHETCEHSFYIKGKESEISKTLISIGNKFIKTNDINEFVSIINQIINYKK